MVFSYLLITFLTAKIGNISDVSKFWSENLRFLLLLQQRGNPEDEDGANDGGTELTEETTPLDAQQREEPAAKGSTEEAKEEVPEEAHATTLHQLAGTEASETSDN